MRKHKLFPIIIPLALLIIAAGIAYLVAAYNQAVQDSNALYGGELEYGYPAAGYLITEKTTGEAAICGVAFLSNRTAITAAHCVTNYQSVYLGQGEFKRNDNSHIQVSALKTYPTGLDLVGLEFSARNDLEPAASTAPIAGCNYLVVAYGRTEAVQSTIKQRKSGSICISNITAQSFMIHGDKSGICFGDSGSAIVRKGTNEVVGVVSAITTNDTKNPCSISNTAIAMRTDVSTTDTVVTQIAQVPAAQNIIDNSISQPGLLAIGALASVAGLVMAVVLWRILRRH